MRRETGDAPDVSEGASIWLQTVLFEQSPSDVDRFFRGVEAAAHLATKTFGVRLVVVVGDSSPRPLLSKEDLAVRAQRLEDFGVDRFDYRFYGENLGSAGGHNRASEGCDSQFVLVANPDVYLCPDVLPELLAAFDDPSVLAAEARQLPLEHPKAFDPLSGDTSWGSGACIMIRSEAWREVDGFDSDSFFLYCDDVDLSWRLRLTGGRVVHRPSARVYHDKRLTPGGLVECGSAEVYYSAEAALMMAWKYSRDDLLASVTRQLRDSGHPEYLRAVDTFEHRRRRRNLPARIDENHTVATFVGSEYAEHRFSYG